ncbi:MAG: hypothetical protein JRF18_07545 [Deltaproteobacteria bacterium]|nr:hypothetical protein [Deltaproteobacteria bacterium]
MARNGLITQQESEAANSSPLNLAEGPSIKTKAPYFVTYVRRFLEKELGSARLHRTGLTVHTTLNYRMQEAAEKAVARGLEQLAARMQERNLPSDEKPQGALVSLDPRQGAILAMVGGKDFEESRFNRATMARRQPGSAFKPLVYACAMEHGFSQSDLIWDAPKGEMTLREALAVSQNIPAVKLLNKLGPSTAVQWAHKMGIESPLQPNLSLVLGTSEVTLLELTAAYGVFPNAGIGARPFAISEVLDQEGRSIWRAKPQLRTVVSPEAAAIMTDMLQAVVESGTGRKAKSLGLPVAGKTGTTDTYRDALFVGFSPTVVTGVWIGLDHYSTLGDKETGARAALPIWIEFMQQALADGPYHDFPLPNGVVEVQIDADSGLLASEDCPNVVTMVLKKGTEPKRWCKHAPGVGLGGL